MKNIFNVENVLKKDREVYREIFNDYNRTYSHGAEIDWHIRRHIMKHPIEKLTENELKFRLYMELKED